MMIRTNETANMRLKATRIFAALAISHVFRRIFAAKAALLIIEIACYLIIRNEWRPLAARWLDCPCMDQCLLQGRHAFFQTNDFLLCGLLISLEFI